MPVRPRPRRPWFYRYWGNVWRIPVGRQPQQSLLRRHIQHPLLRYADRADFVEKIIWKKDDARLPLSSDGVDALFLSKGQHQLLADLALAGIGFKELVLIKTARENYVDEATAYGFIYIVPALFSFVIGTAIAYPLRFDITNNPLNLLSQGAVFVTVYVIVRLIAFNLKQGSFLTYCTFTGQTLLGSLRERDRLELESDSKGMLKSILLVVASLFLYLFLGFAFLVESSMLYGPYNIHIYLVTIATALFFLQPRVHRRYLLICRRRERIALRNGAILFHAFIHQISEGSGDD